MAPSAVGAINIIIMGELASCAAHLSRWGKWRNACGNPTAFTSVNDDNFGVNTIFKPG